MCRDILWSGSSERMSARVNLLLRDLTLLQDHRSTSKGDRRLPPDLTRSEIPLAVFLRARRDIVCRRTLVRLHDTLSRGAGHVKALKVFVVPDVVLLYRSSYLYI